MEVKSSGEKGKEERMGRTTNNKGRKREKMEEGEHGTEKEQLVDEAKYGRFKKSISLVRSEERKISNSSSCSTDLRFCVIGQSLGERNFEPSRRISSLSLYLIWVLSQSC